MKTLFHLVWMRLSEQPAKILYLTVMLAAGVLSWMVLSAFASPALLSGAGDVVDSRLFVGNARVQYGKFPLHYIPRIRRVPGVDHVAWMTSTSFYCADGSRKSVTVIGVAKYDDRRFLDNGISETDLTAWKNTENGLLVGPETAKRCSLIPGMTISPQNLHGKGEIPLRIIAVLSEEGGPIDRMTYGHYDYVNRLMPEKKQNQVKHAIVTVRDPAAMDQVAVMIEREFQSSDPPMEAVVFAETSALGRFGQVQALLLLIMGAMALCVFLVFCAVLVHLTAQRRASMAVLQTMGFTGRIQFFALLLEIISVVIVGAACGIAAGYGALALLTPWASDTLLSPDLRPVDGAIVVLLPALLLLLTAALFWPAVQIAKLRPMDYLRL